MEIPEDRDLQARRVSRDRSGEKGVQDPKDPRDCEDRMGRKERRELEKWEMWDLQEHQASRDPKAMARWDLLAPSASRAYQGCRDLLDILVPRARTAVVIPGTA